MLFVEVNSVEKGCPVIVNLEHISEIAPLKEGGCLLFMADGAGMNSKTSIHVENDFSEFKQFAMQTVTAEDIEKRFPSAKKANKKSIEEQKFGVSFDNIPKL